MAKSSKIIYIAGPVQDNAKSSRELNIRRGYAETRIFLCSHNALCVSPYFIDWVLMDLDLLDKFGFNQFMDYSLRLLSICDAVYVLPNYEHSKGAQMEIEVAAHSGKPILLSEDEVVKYLKSN